MEGAGGGGLAQAVDPVAKAYEPLASASVPAFKPGCRQYPGSDLYSQVSTVLAGEKKYMTPGIGRELLRGRC